MSSNPYINPDDLAEKLKSIRKEKGLDQKELASLLHVSRQTVIEWEKGRATPKSDYLIALCNLYDRDIDYLIGRLEEPTHDIKFICDQTGLSARAVLKLKQKKRSNRMYSQILSWLLESNDFDEIISRVNSFIQIKWAKAASDSMGNPDKKLDKELTKEEERLFYLSHKFTGLIEAIAKKQAK